MNTQESSILEMAQGAMIERFNYENEKVFRNIMDPNTKATAKRKITMELTYEPDEERNTIRVSCVAKSKLEPTEAVKTTLAFYRDENTGQAQAVELNGEAPGQQFFTETGAIEEHENKIFKLAQKAGQ